MSARRTLARFGALTATTALVGLMAAPAGAHVSGTPSVSTAGSFTILTMSVPHGCEGSPTTKVEIQIPEPVLSVTPTRNPLYGLDVNIQQLDEPLTDAHGNEVTERVGSIVYTAQTPLPEGQRDTFELSFQIPDAAGETLVFPTIQTCKQGRADWVQVPEEGQDGEELEYPAPSFEVMPASDDADGHGASAEDASSETSAGGAEVAEDSAAADSVAGDSDALGWAALGLGALGLVTGGTALVRTRNRA